MTKVLLIVTLILSSQVNADEFSSMKFDLPQLNSHRKCQIQECRKNDYGESFRQFCSIQHIEDVMGRATVGYLNSISCYCPCWTDFIYKVTNP
ncbi:MAG: hypothetical protein WA160_06900 [Pseudobdellovibrio sp.]